MKRNTVKRNTVKRNTVKINTVKINTAKRNIVKRNTLCKYIVMSATKLLCNNLHLTLHFVRLKCSLYLSCFYAFILNMFAQKHRKDSRRRHKKIKRIKGNQDLKNWKKHQKLDLATTLTNVTQAYTLPFILWYIGTKVESIARWWVVLLSPDQSMTVFTGTAQSSATRT